MNSYHKYYSIMDYLNFMKKEIKKLLIIITLFLAIAWIYIYKTTDYVIIRFDELGPINKNMTAYYNGFKIGKIVSIEPDKDFKHTLVRVNLTHKNMKLPQNTTAYVERFPNGDLYLQFLYPESPSLEIIKRGDILEGRAPYSLEQFMLGQSISGVTDIVSIHVIKALNAMDVANKEIEQFFRITSKLIQANEKGITASVNNTVTMTKNLAQMAENLNQASKKINDSLDETTLKDTTSNVKGTTLNIKDTTENISKATKNIGKTMETIDDTINQVNAIARNLNSITSGLNETLGKKFAGMRLIFGTPVKQKNCCKNSCN